MTLIIILVINILCDKESQHVFNLYLALSYDFISVIPDVFPPWSLMRENEYKVVAQAKLYILMTMIIKQPCHSKNMHKKTEQSRPIVTYVLVF